MGRPPRVCAPRQQPLCPVVGPDGYQPASPVCHWQRHVIRSRSTTTAPPIPFVEVPAMPCDELDLISSDDTDYCPRCHRLVEDCDGVRIPRDASADSQGLICPASRGATGL